MKTKSDLLIDNLRLNLRPVRTVKWSSIFAAHLLLFLILATAWILFDGLRSDIHEQMTDPWFLTESGTLLILVLTGFYLISRWVIPGNDRVQKSSQLLTFSALIIWISLIGFSFFGSGFHTSSFRETFGSGCVIGIAVITALSTFFSFLFIRRAAPVKPAWTGFVSVSVSAAFGALLLHFTCTSSEPLHLLSSHLPPVVLASAFGYFLGRTFLRW
ncbi:MAG: hypothetical protein JWQ35_560 [Bacteriovoracaceae bacterium]|nr:hypothetical protein [Bacteriovoracaceae bacterium]